MESTNPQAMAMSCGPHTGEKPIFDLKRPLSRYSETLGYHTHYIEQGEGPPIILIHGRGPGADGWGYWFDSLPAFGEKFRAIAIDLAGYGGTEAPEGYVYSQENRNKQLTAFIEALDAGPVSVIGNSMGGATALGAAMLRPDLISSLVLVGSTGLNDDDVGAADRANNPPARYDYTLEGMRRLAKHLCGRNFEAAAAMLEYRVAMAGRPERRASFGAINKWAAEARDLSYAPTEIAAVKTRSLVFNGKDDPIVTNAHTFKFLELLENSTGYILPHCGHWAMLEHPEIFTSQSIQFLTADT